uniref:Uncharacterized protein n=1 Tax=Glossina morsitans morsitans TaxID=37546 RepID=A0A1B0F9W8_GLOMM
MPIVQSCNRLGQYSCLRCKACYCEDHVRQCRRVHTSGGGYCNYHGAASGYDDYVASNYSEDEVSNENDHDEEEENEDESENDDAKESNKVKEKTIMEEKN